MRARPKHAPSRQGRLNFLSAVFIYAILAERIDVISVMHYRQLLPDDLQDLSDESS
jgi:hypothetical protein